LPFGKLKALSSIEGPFGKPKAPSNNRGA